MPHGHDVGQARLRYFRHHRPEALYMKDGQLRTGYFADFAATRLPLDWSLQQMLLFAASRRLFDFAAIRQRLQSIHNTPESDVTQLRFWPLFAIT